MSGWAALGSLLAARGGPLAAWRAVAAAAASGGASCSSAAAAVGAVASSSAPAPAAYLQQQRAGYAAKAAPKGGKGAPKGGAKAKAGGKAGAKAAAAKAKGPPPPADSATAKLVALLAPSEARPLFEGAAELEEGAARAREYSRLKLAEHGAWQQDVKRKVGLKLAALAALPEELRAAAAAEDTEAPPLARNALFDTPPTAYKE